MLFDPAGSIKRRRKKEGKHKKSGRIGGGKELSGGGGESAGTILLLFRADHKYWGKGEWNRGSDRNYAQFKATSLWGEKWEEKQGEKTDNKRMNVMTFALSRGGQR